MSVSFKYWDDCVDPEDMRSMWMDAAVSKEWIDAGERMGQKVHLSRDPDGEPYLTQTEMRAVAEIIVQRHFNSQLDPDMLCAVAEIASNRILLIENYDKKKKERTAGLMQIAPEVAEWLARAEEIYDDNPLASDGLRARMLKAGEECTFWDSAVSAEDMEEMWKHPDVLKEWAKSGERRGRVRFSHDSEKRPYLSRVEVKAVAEIIISRHFSSRGVNPTALAALAEVCSMRFVNGIRSRTGLMGIDYPTALWLYKDVGCRAYKVTSVDDLYNPFVSMYFGAAYLAWLSEYEGRERSHEFIVQAYLGGPENVNLQETGPLWNKFQEALSYYGDSKKDQGSCCIL
ncbi:hypothetical protein ACMD2_09240 [Ananas comosus]|uniref:Transglycosylase SLT domain-containing protein n=1 Tax=Ananas comosus TaxID=4615 RepID=A0A199V275_ANACO|nr:hypothetical protein ACMD2_09240 [Ananas comosus]